MFIRVSSAFPYDGISSFPYRTIDQFSLSFAEAFHCYDHNIKGNSTKSFILI